MNSTIPFSVLYELDDDTKLIEYNLSKWHNIINNAASACIPLLETRPALPYMYGKQCRMNRNVGFFANPSDSYGYFYSKQLSASQPPPEELNVLKELVNVTFGTKFNGILVNQYLNGYDYISPHSDDEYGLDNDIGVFCISYGAERTFRLRRITLETKNPIVYDAITKTCHALLMSGKKFQKKLQHEVPIRSRICDQRVSFTFRIHNKQKEELMYKNWVKAQ